MRLITAITTAAAVITGRLLRAVTGRHCTCEWCTAMKDRLP